MKAHPYTPQQVIHNLQNMIEQLRDYPPNLEGGPGWCRKQAESIVARGIVGDKQHSSESAPLKTIQDILTRYKVTASKTLASGETAIRKGGMWLYFWWNPATKQYNQSGSSAMLYPNT